MDLSQFAQTARQLVEQANVIESATRDPAREAAKAYAPAGAPTPPVPSSAAKQRIADLLKGLEFGKGEGDSDDLEAPAQAAARAAEEPVDVEAARGEKSSSLAADLKPNRESVSRNWLGTGSHAQQEQPQPAQLPPIDVAVTKGMPPAAAAPSVSAMTNEEFRDTFEFLNSDSLGLSESLVQPKMSETDGTDDRTSKLAQAGLSADSLMNELSVMNELQCAHGMIPAAQVTQPPAKEESIM